MSEGAAGQGAKVLLGVSVGYPLFGQVQLCGRPRPSRSTIQQKAKSERKWYVKPASSRNPVSPVFGQVLLV